MCMIGFPGRWEFVQVGNALRILIKRTKLTGRKREGEQLGARMTNGEHGGRDQEGLSAHPVNMSL